MGCVRATFDERENDMGTKQVRIEEVERGFLYLQGCLDIARTRSTDLSLFNAVTEALKTSRQLADQGRYEQADDTLSAMAGRLKAAGPQPPNAGRAYPRH